MNHCHFQDLLVSSQKEYKLQEKYDHYQHFQQRDSHIAYNLFFVLYLYYMKRIFPIPYKPTTTLFLNSSSVIFYYPNYKSTNSAFFTFSESVPINK